jgi:hypothetical protein
MYIKHLLKRTTYSILDLISDQCLDKLNTKFHTYYKKRKVNREAQIYASDNQFEYDEIKRLMEEIPKGTPNCK